MTESEFLKAVRKLAEENGLDFFAATRNVAVWDFQRDESPKLCKLADVCQPESADKED